MQTQIYVIVRGPTNVIGSQYFFESFEEAYNHIQFYNMNGCEIRTLFHATQNLDYKEINVGPTPKI
jgi:hypothetical protein